MLSTTRYYSRFFGMSKFLKGAWAPSSRKSHSQPFLWVLFSALLAKKTVSLRGHENFEKKTSYITYRTMHVSGCCVLGKLPSFAVGRKWHWWTIYEANKESKIFMAVADMIETDGYLNVNVKRQPPLLLCRNPSKLTWSYSLIEHNHNQYWCSIPTTSHECELQKVKTLHRQFYIFLHFYTITQNSTAS